MKNITKALIIALVFFCTGISCTGEAGEDTDALKVAAAKKELVIPTETDSNLDLPLVLNGVTISWVSSDEDVISNSGLVTRQPYDTQVTLTATLTLGSVSDTKEFTVRVTVLIVFKAEDMVEFYKWDYNPDVAGMYNQIKMIHPDENVVFHCTVDNGGFYTPLDPLTFNNPTKNVSVHSGDIIHWFDIVRVDGQYAGEVEYAFIEIIVKLDENIIGYAVIEAYSTIRSSDRKANLLKSVLFPQINGAYQSVSEEYVKTAIEKIKEDKTKEDNKISWDGTFFVVEPKVMFRLDYWTDLASNVEPNWIEMKHPDKNVVFNCTVDNGHFRLYLFSGKPVIVDENVPEDIPAKNMSVHSGYLIRWESRERGEDGKFLDGVRAEHAFIEVILRLEENIIGYAVIEVHKKPSLLAHYGANLLKSVLFPQVDGAYQNVSEEYVKTAIEKVKNENKGDTTL